MKVFFEQRPSASKPHPQTTMGMERTHTLGNMDGKWQEHGWEYGQRRAQDEPKTPPRRSKMRLRCPKTSPRRPQMVKKHENSHVPGEWGALTPQEHTWESIRCHFKILLGLYSGVLWIIMCTMRPWGFPTMFLVMLMIQPSRNMATRDHLKILLRNVSERFIGLEGSSNADPS